MGKQRKDRGAKRGKQCERERRRARQGSGPRAPRREGVSALDLEDLTGLPLEPERLAPTVYLDANLQPLPDPYRTLGLEPGEEDPELVRAAWQRAMAACDPEREPERARELTRARDWLADPRRMVERIVGTLRPPDPVAHGLPLPEDLPDEEAVEARPSRIGDRRRLLGQLYLYALLEADGEQGPVTGLLFD